MARIRTIKPEFFSHEELSSKSAHARLLAIGLLTLADCEGRLRWVPMQVHAHVFPWEATVKIEGTKLVGKGPLLVTHWGMSGPAILKLSAFGARTLSEMNYQFKVQVNWVGEPNYEKAAETLREALVSNPNKHISNVKPFTLPDRLWQFLLQRSEIPEDKKASELSKKHINKLVNTLTNDEYSVSGKTTFKEEFVTCGGVSLSSVNFNTMESRVVANLYFAGEVLDIDGITGGYNFQAAWTTGFIAGKLG
jgi:predicted Rossmann fold flavoprotein